MVFQKVVYLKLLQWLIQDFPEVDTKSEGGAKVAKVMFLQVCVCPQGGCLVWGVCSQGGGAWSGGVCSLGVPGHGGLGIPACTEAAPPRKDGYCCGWYASYWNAFLFGIMFAPNGMKNWTKRAGARPPCPLPRSANVLY